MTELKGWCIIKHTGGYVSYQATHRFMPYETFFLKRPMYFCLCGIKITPQEHSEYFKYLIARKKVQGRSK